MKNLYLFIVVSLLSFSVAPAFAAINHIITVADFSFSPDTVTVETGDTITWVWESGFHTTTANGIPDGASQWNEIIDSLHTSFRYIVSVPGTYNYISVPDLPGMTGKFTLPGVVGIHSPTDPLFTLSLSSNIGSNTIAVNYDLMNSNRVDLALYNSVGVRLQTLMQENVPAGKHIFVLDLDGDLPSGMYFIRMQAGTAFLSRKLMIQ